MPARLALATLLLLSQCAGQSKQPLPHPVAKNNLITTPGNTVAAIPLPEGFARTAADSGSFAYWLRQLLLKKDKTVYLFNGAPKDNQQAQYAVLDVSVGAYDLQQCADAVMRLRADYLRSIGRENDIAFRSVDGPVIDYRSWKQGKRWKERGNRLIAYNSNQQQHPYDKYLITVFSYCSTLSLDQQLKTVARFTDIQPGDVLVKGGAPGHAVVVVDVAVNAAGKKIFLLAQSYMPAQDIHILKNPANPDSNPWYEVNNNPIVDTPEWTFVQKQLKRW
jgi:hypothetical protein